MTQQIPFIDLTTQLAELKPEIDRAFAAIMASGRIMLGPEVSAFEQEWAAWVGAKHAVGVANGLDALVLGLEACGVGPGDEVIVPSNTYIATWLAVSQLGATPVPVEPLEATANLDPAKIAAAITPRTKAVMPVHLYGHPADMAPILAVARTHGLKVVEDAAQCHGAAYRGKRIGAHGDVVAWSFYPTKNLGAIGDAGAITTDDPMIADRITVARNYGARVRYVCEMPGRNSRLDELQAAVLRIKLRHLDTWNARRAVLAARYAQGLAGLPVVIPVEPPGCTSVWHLYTIRTPRREALRKHLEAAGVGVIVHYPIPPHLQQAYASLGFKRGDLPIAERIHDQVLSLPLHPYLCDADQERIIAGIREWAVLQEHAGR